MVEEQPITLEAIEARSLCRPDLSATDVVTVLGSDSSPPEPRTHPEKPGEGEYDPHWFGRGQGSRARPSGAFEDEAVRG